MVDPLPMWDFDDAAGSERRFRAAADLAEGSDRLVLLTQIARALGLQERYDEGHAVLDDLVALDPEVAVRISLERGRLLRSGGSPDLARPHFEAAAASAAEARLDALRIDALHMVALVAPAEQQVGLTEAALALARASHDPRANDWDASLLNNLGMAYADAGGWDRALTAFEEANVACERIGDDSRTRVARWMVGWALRNLGRTSEALAVQRGLKADLVAAGLEDPYVEEELAFLEG